MVHKLLPLCLVFPLFGSAVMLAQECTNQFNRAVWHPEQGLISASVMHPLHPTEQSSAKWLLLDSTGNLPVDLAPVAIRNYGDPDHPDIPPADPSVSIYLMPVQPLLINHLYYLRAQNVRTTGCPKPQAELSPTIVLTKRAKTPAFATSASTSRDDSDFYFAPTVDGASGSKASYTLDAKLQHRTALVAPEFGTNTPYRPGINLVPGVDLKISSNPKEDGNSVLFQVPLEIVTIIDPISSPGVARMLPAVISRPGFVAEADKKFHDINGIFSDGEYFVLRGWGHGAVQVVPEPMIGFETGSNLKAQQAGTYPDSILRAEFGLRAVMTIFQPKKAKPLFSIESNYIRRLLLHPEPVYTVNSTGNYVLVSVGTNPRDDVNVKLSYNLTSYVALSLGYEYGELPPMFTKVNNKYTFGITFKGELQSKPSNTTK
jgi:hypothetical protein